MAQADPATPKQTVILVHGIRTHANWYQRAREVFSSIEGLEVEPIKYGRFDLLSFLIPGPWRRGPLDKTAVKILPILERCREEGRRVTIIAHSNGTNVVAQLLKTQPVFKFDNLIMCGSVIDSDYDWELVRHKIKGELINDYGVRDIWPAVARSVTWGYGYSGTNGFGAPVEDRLHDTPHSAYFAPEFMRTYWESFLRTGEVVRPKYGDGAIPSSPWWFTLLEIPWKWVVPLAAIGIAGWSLYPRQRSVEPGPTTVAVSPPTDTMPANQIRGPSMPAQAEIAVFTPECTRNPAPATAEELQEAMRQAAIVHTARWLRLAIAEIGQREQPGPEHNPKILEYAATAYPVQRTDEQPWNSQFVNFIMRRVGYAGTNNGRAQSWLSWGKDVIADAGDPVVGSIVIASREGIPEGGYAGFYMGLTDNGNAIRMLAGSLCNEVTVVTVPVSKVMGYRVPSDWVGVAS